MGEALALLLDGVSLIDGVHRSVRLDMVADCCLVCCFLLNVFSSNLRYLVSMSEKSKVSLFALFSRRILMIREYCGLIVDYTAVRKISASWYSI
jgi:hypothetical protein